MIDWPKVFMLPRRVTIDSAARKFQYRALNNIVCCNGQLFEVNLSDNLYCSFCKSSYEHVIHVGSTLDHVVSRYHLEESGIAQQLYLCEWRVSAYIF